MNLTIYGSTQCAACKTLLKMAKGQGIEPVYKQIDVDPQARAEYEALQFAGRQLPAAVAATDVTSVAAVGLHACIPLLKLVKEAQ